MRANLDFSFAAYCVRYGALLQQEYARQIAAGLNEGKLFSDWAADRHDDFLDVVADALSTASGAEVVLNYDGGEDHVTVHGNVNDDHPKARPTVAQSAAATKTMNAQRVHALAVAALHDMSTAGTDKKRQIIEQRFNDAVLDVLQPLEIELVKFSVNELIDFIEFFSAHALKQFDQSMYPTGKYSLCRVPYDPTSARICTGVTIEDVVKYWAVENNMQPILELNNR